MSQSLESSHRCLHKHNRKWDVCGKGSGEGAGVRTMECGSGLAGPPTQHRAAQEAQERGTRFSAPSNSSSFEGPWRPLRPKFPALPSMSVWGN